MLDVGAAPCVWRAGGGGSGCSPCSAARRPAAAGEETLGEFITVGIRALSAHAVVGALTGVAAIFAVLVVRAITERMAAQIVALPVRWRPPLTEGDESDRRGAPTV